MMQASEEQLKRSFTYLIVIWTIRALLYRCVLFLISNLYTNDRIHVETRQLTCFDNSDANLKILCFQMLFYTRYRPQSMFGAKYNIIDLRCLHNKHLELPATFAFRCKFLIVFTIARVIRRCLWYIITAVDFLGRCKTTHFHISANQWPILMEHLMSLQSFSNKFKLKWNSNFKTPLKQKFFLLILKKRWLSRLKTLNL